MKSQPISLTFIVCIFTALSPGLAPAESPLTYDAAYGAADASLKAGLLTAAQARDLRAALEDQVRKLADCVEKEAGLPRALRKVEWSNAKGTRAVLEDEPYDLFEAIRASGELAAAVDHAGSVGHSLEKPGSCDYWGIVGEIREATVSWSRHARALASAYANAARKGGGGAPASLFDAASTEDLKEYYKEGAHSDYLKAVKSLLARGEKAVLRKNLSDPNPNRYHHMTAWAIASAHPDDFTEDMARLLKDEDPAGRFYAAYFLAVLKKGEYADRVALLLLDRSMMVRQVAARYMGMVKSVKHRPGLEKLLKDPSEGVRLEAKDALEAIKAP